MSLFRKIFGSKNKTAQEHVNYEASGKYMPDVKLPIDERFTINFKANGGKFLYCIDFNEVIENLGYIIEENKWKNEKMFLIDNKLKNLFKPVPFNTSKSPKEATYFLSTCEYLIANDGSLLISSNQIAEKNLNELPTNLVIFATTSQFVESISEGLHGIKTKNKASIPTNITKIKHFKIGEEHDFLSYGCSSKNLYLLLLEDL
ncbi:MAG: LUD domain-containing protein [Flavobacteriaceae bacterium]|nr:LUD domain-containing protein [Flavobacteriaceae bacterium]